jgi:hypothetical protein
MPESMGSAGVSFRFIPRLTFLVQPLFCFSWELIALVSGRSSFSPLEPATGDCFGALWEFCRLIGRF